MHKLDSNPISWWEIRSRRLAAAVSQSSYEVAARRRAVNLSKAHSPREERSSVSFTSWFCSRILVSITQNVRPHAHTHTHTITLSCVRIAGEHGSPTQRLKRTCLFCGKLAAD